MFVETEIHLYVTYGLVWLPALEQDTLYFSLVSTPLETRWLFELLLSCYSFNVAVLVIVCLFFVVCLIACFFFNLVQLLYDLKTDWSIEGFFFLFFVCLFVFMFSMFWFCVILSVYFGFCFFLFFGLLFQQIPFVRQIITFLRITYFLQAACVAVAALMQYFLMASFCWMLVEGIYIYLFVVKVYNITDKMHRYHGFCWGKERCLQSSALANVITLELNYFCYMSHLN